MHLHCKWVNGEWSINTLTTTDLVSFQDQKRKKKKKRERAPETLSPGGALQLFPFTALTTCPPTQAAQAQPKVGDIRGDPHGDTHLLGTDASIAPVTPRCAIRPASRGRTPSMPHSERKSSANKKSNFAKHWLLKLPSAGSRFPRGGCAGTPARPGAGSKERCLPERLRMTSRNSSAAASPPAAGPGRPGSAMPGELRREAGERGWRDRAGPGVEQRCPPWNSAGAAAPAPRPRGRCRGAISEHWPPRGRRGPRTPPVAARGRTGRDGATLSLAAAGI